MQNALLYSQSVFCLFLILVALKKYFYSIVLNDILINTIYNNSNNQN